MLAVVESLKCLKPFSVDAVMVVICSGESVDLSSHEGAVQSFSWRSDGSTLASTCKDKQLRVFDVRASTVVQVVIAGTVLCLM